MSDHDSPLRIAERPIRKSCHYAQCNNHFSLLLVCECLRVDVEVIPIR